MCCGLWDAWWVSASGRRAAAMARTAVGIVLAGLVFVPYVMGMNGTSLFEWIGALGGIEAGLVMGNRFRRRFTDAELSDTRSRSTAARTAPPSRPGQTS